MVIIGFIIAFIQTTIDLTNCINSFWKLRIFWIYVSSIIIIYFIGLIANSFTLAIKLKNATINNNGLINQHQLDLKDKKKLKTCITEKEIFIDECWKKLSTEDKQIVFIESERRRRKIDFESSEDN